MATSSYQTYLMYKETSGSSYTKLIDIKDYPDMGGSPELLETTTLSDNMQTNILGIQSLDALEFTANYDKAAYTTLKGLEGKQYDFALYLGTDGADGKFTWKGEITSWLTGKGVNEVREITISVAAATVIEFADA